MTTVTTTYTAAQHGTAVQFRLLGPGLERPKGLVDRHREDIQLGASDLSVEFRFGRKRSGGRETCVDGLLFSG